MSYQCEDWRELQPHPLAEHLPMMNAETQAAMRIDIATHGFDPRWPIVLYEGRVLDGRNRLECCRRAGVSPWLEEFDGDDPVAFVIRANISRRDLTPSQKAAAAVALYPQFQEEAKKRQRDHGQTAPGRSKTLGVSNTPSVSDPSERAPKAVQELAETVGVKESTMQRALRLASKAPDLFEATKKGGITVSKGYKALREREGDAQAKKAAHAEDRRKAAAKAAAAAKRIKKPDARLSTLAEFETFIEARAEAFSDVAWALLEIREQGLYSATHGGFNRYLLERWGIPFTMGRAVRCGIDAVQLIRDLEDRR